MHYNTLMEKPRGPFLILLAILLMISVQQIQSAPFNDTLDLKINGKEECAKHTGWPTDLIEVSTTYNDGCAVVCIIKGKADVDTSFNIRQGLPCYDHEHICYDGSCYDKGQEPKSIHTADKVYATIKIHGASVRDADPWPLQGLSDPFAIVEELSDDSSSNLFCHTKTIQDSNAPKWMHTCKSNPLSMKSKLRFSVYDSDKPAEKPDKLGSATVVVEDIANGEPHALSLDGSKGAGTTGPYIKVSISINNNSNSNARESIETTTTTQSRNKGPRDTVRLEREAMIN